MERKLVFLESGFHQSILLQEKVLSLQKNWCQLSEWNQLNIANFVLHLERKSKLLRITYAEKIIPLIIQSNQVRQCFDTKKPFYEMTNKDTLHFWTRLLNNAKKSPKVKKFQRKKESSWTQKLFILIKLLLLSWVIWLGVGKCLT